jgi:hypothetical protein
MKSATPSRTRAGVHEALVDDAPVRVLHHGAAASDHGQAKGRVAQGLQARRHHARGGESEGGLVVVQQAAQVGLALGPEALMPVEERAVEIRDVEPHAPALLGL